MRIAAVLAVAMLGGCAGAGGLTIANNIGLGVQTSALACDWHQTREIASRRWPYVIEANPILGRAPRPAKVDLYFLAVFGLSVLGWRVAPPRWRPVVSLAVTAIQVHAITGGLFVDPRAGMTLCGL